MNKKSLMKHGKSLPKKKIRPSFRLAIDFIQRTKYTYLIIACVYKEKMDLIDFEYDSTSHHFFISSISHATQCKIQMIAIKNHKDKI